MNVDEAKLLLGTLQPGQTESEDPKLAEALALAGKDAVLREWLVEQQRLDHEVGAQLNSIPVPAGLRSQLLALPRQRSNISYLRPVLAIAACVALIAFAGRFWWQSRPVDFAALREHLLDQSWGTSPHLALRSSRWEDVRLWLSAQHLATDFQVPSALQHAKLKGCSIVHWHGYAVPVLCLLEENRHVHLYVVDRAEVLGVPSGAVPVLADYGAMKTFSWTQANRSYVLTGFNPQSFLKKFRKSGHWLLTT